METTQASFTISERAPGVPEAYLKAYVSVFGTRRVAVTEALTTADLGQYVWVWWEYPKRTDFPADCMAGGCVLRAEKQQPEYETIGTREFLRLVSLQAKLDP
jgi:hypothetical protein